MAEDPESDTSDRLNASTIRLGRVELATGKVERDLPAKKVKTSIDPGGQQALSNPSEQTGRSPLPGVNVLAISETAATAKLFAGLRRDRRFIYANLDVYESGFERGVEYLRSSNCPPPSLIILEAGSGDRELLAQVNKLSDFCPAGTHLLILGQENDIGLYRKLRALGVDEYLLKPSSVTELARAASSIFVRPDALYQGQVTAVLGAAGGGGASTIAHNMAWSLAETFGLKTTLVDLDLTFGTSSTDYDCDTQVSISDVVLAGTQLDGPRIEQLLTPVSDRLSALVSAASLDFDKSPPMTSQVLRNLLRRLRESTPHIVLDLPHLWAKWVRDAVCEADKVILVVEPELISIRNGNNLLNALTGFYTNSEKPFLVINKSDMPKRPELSATDIESILKRTPDCFVPFDPKSFGAVSADGGVIIDRFPNCAASRALFKLAHLVVAHDPPVIRSRSFARRLQSFLTK